MADGEREKTREELLAENLELKKKVEKQEKYLEEQYHRLYALEHIAERYLSIIENLSKGER